MNGNENHASELNFDFYTKQFFFVYSLRTKHLCKHRRRYSANLQREQLILTGSEFHKITKKRKERKMINKKWSMVWPRRTTKESNQSNKYEEFKIINV